MSGWIHSFVDNSVQCWGCEVFDRLFQIVSISSGVMYEQMTFVVMVLFSALLITYIFNAVFQNIKSGGTDPLYTKSVVKVIINSVIVLSLLHFGVGVPRAVTRVTIEPAAQIVLEYTKALTQNNIQTVNERVTYLPTEPDIETRQEIDKKGIFRLELRDTIIDIMKTTITQFQSYMKLGVEIVGGAFTWNALLGVGAFIKHFGMLLIGLFLFYGFFKLFINFCFRFADIIVGMALFAFIFPLSLMMMIFDGVEHVPEVVKNINKNISKDQIKKLINAIVSLGACVLTYTVMVLIVVKFFTDSDATSTQIMNNVVSGNVFDLDISDTNLEALSLASIIILIYVLTFIYKQIPQITKMILDTFGVSEEHKISDQMADGAMTVTKNAVGAVASFGKVAIDKFRERNGLAKESKAETDNTKQTENK